MAGEMKDFRMQEIHTPSAFEGALWAATGVKDGITIFHAPPGCYINQHVNMLVNDWTMELYATNLSYANVMQGAEDRLEEVMRTVIAKKNRRPYLWSPRRASRSPRMMLKAWPPRSALRTR